MNLKRASLAATVVLGAAIVSLLLRRALFAHGPVLIAMQVVAGAVMLWARATFGLRSFHAAANPTTGGLVTTGPYRFVRHPIYAAILLFVWAGVAANGSIVSTLIAFVATAATAARIAMEERLVVQTYPEYQEYARRTKRIVPFVV
jgi:protein-S-isoprenylcysteine O-methyltransferase Ste14